jgi:hypothetical protein
MRPVVDIVNLAMGVGPVESLLALEDTLPTIEGQRVQTK